MTKTVSTDTDRYQVTAPLQLLLLRINCNKRQAEGVVHLHYRVPIFQLAQVRLYYHVPILQLAQVHLYYSTPVLLTIENENHSQENPLRALDTHLAGP